MNTHFENTIVFTNLFLLRVQVMPGITIVDPNVYIFILLNIHINLDNRQRVKNKLFLFRFLHLFVPSLQIYRIVFLESQHQVHPYSLILNSQPYIHVETMALF